MKTAKLSLMFLACAAAIPAFAQNSTDSRCGMTNFDRNRNMFTIVNPTPGMANQQCFITVVPKQSWRGGMPDLTSSELVEGNYEITLAGGGGGGGGGAGIETEHGHPEAASGGNGGNGGHSAVPFTTVRYLSPGIYRLTIGSGGQGGLAGPNGEHSAHNGGEGADGAPSSLADASTGQTVAGFPGAESWNGTYPLTALAYSGPPAALGARVPDGGRGAGDNHAKPGASGGNGFIRIALKDPPPQAQQPAPANVAPAAPAEIMPMARPPRVDRN